MKKSRILYLFAFFALSAWIGTPATAQPGVAVSFQTFYNELSPYGRWSSHPQYGSIWMPYNVDRDFQPYATNGQWMMTEYGNTWVSDYDWGWAPFHYGRWFYDDFNGWAWVPDYQWGPAWVDWRSGGGYYGWAPMWPGVRVGVSFNIPFNFWVFVPQRYVYRPRVFGFCVYGNRYRNVYNQTTIINNYYRNDNRVYAYGPRRSEIEQVTRGSVPVYRADEIRGSRYTSGRQSSDGSYRANGNSESGLYRQDRDNDNGNSNRSSRQAFESDNGGTSNRGTYESGSSSRSRGSYESGSSRSYESTVPSSSRTYESGEPSSRARSGYSRGSGSTPGSSTYRSPEGRSSVESPSGRTRSSASSRSSSPYSAPEARSGNSSSRARSMEQSSSRSSSGYSQPSRSSSPRMEAPASRGRSSEAPSRSNSNSSSSSSSSRSRGPR